MDYEIRFQAHNPRFYLFPFFDFSVKIRWLEFIKLFRFTTLRVLPLLPSLMGIINSIIVGLSLGAFYSFTRGSLR
jgi:hypothetical protein